MSTFIKMTEIYNGFSVLFLLPASFLVIVMSSFSKELTLCIYEVPKSFGRSHVGWFCCSLFYTTVLFIYVFCIFSRNKKIVQHLLLKKENVTKYSAFTQEDYPLNNGYIQFSCQFFFIGNFYL